MSKLVAGLAMAGVLSSCGSNTSNQQQLAAATPAAGTSAATANPFKTEAWWQSTDVADWLDKCPTRCELHGVATETDTVEMYCGTVFFGRMSELHVDPLAYKEARRASFPNANSFASYDYEHWAARVRYCAACREVEQQWLQQHKGA